MGNEQEELKERSGARRSTSFVSSSDIRESQDYDVLRRASERIFGEAAADVM